MDCVTRSCSFPSDGAGCNAPRLYHRLSAHATRSAAPVSAQSATLFARARRPPASSPETSTARRQHRRRVDSAGIEQHGIHQPLDGETHRQPDRRSDRRPARGPCPSPGAARPSVAAPMAMRMPISRVLRLTLYATSPYKPAMASSRPTAPMVADQFDRDARPFHGVVPIQILVGPASPTSAGSDRASGQCPSRAEPIAADRRSIAPAGPFARPDAGPAADTRSPLGLSVVAADT